MDGVILVGAFVTVIALILIGFMVYDIIQQL
jgi:hypothetical protein